MYKFKLKCSINNGTLDQELSDIQKRLDKVQAKNILRYSKEDIKDDLLYLRMVLQYFLEEIEKINIHFSFSETFNFYYLNLDIEYPLDINVKPIIDLNGKWKNFIDKRESIFSFYKRVDLKYREFKPYIEDGLKISDGNLLSNIKEYLSYLSVFEIKASVIMDVSYRNDLIDAMTKNIEKTKSLIIHIIDDIGMGNSEFEEIKDFKALAKVFEVTFIE
jgi:predicted DNA-binding protein YlxM (UPF0122 family)